MFVIDQATGLPLHHYRAVVVVAVDVIAVAVFVAVVLQKQLGSPPRLPQSFNQRRTPSVFFELI